MNQCTLAIVIVYTLQSLHVTIGVPAKSCGEGVEYVPDLDECNTYYICIAGIPRKYCSGNFSFRPDIQDCVPKGSLFDPCVPSPCGPGDAGKMPHPKNCAVYHDCNVTIDEPRKPRLIECRYPYLYNTESRRCEHYRRVNCGSRSEPKDPCGYYANQCRRHCSPCYTRYPSCEGLSDGLHSWRGKEGTPDYVGCRQERVIFQRRCPNRDQIFHPQLRKCVLYDSNS